jgi:hypothetical protein
MTRHHDTSMAVMFSFIIASSMFVPVKANIECTQTLPEGAVWKQFCVHWECKDQWYPVRIRELPVSVSESESASKSGSESKL